MEEDYNRNRRDILKTTGASLAALTGAGCIGGQPEYEEEAKNRLSAAINSVDPNKAAEGNYLITDTKGPEIHKQGEGDLNNRHWMIIRGDTDENFGQYVSGDQFDRQAYGPATGSRLAEFKNDINTQLNAALNEHLEGFEEEYGFNPVRGDENRPEASPVLWGSEIRFLGNQGSALESSDVVPLETDASYEDMDLDVEEQGFTEGLF